MSIPAPLGSVEPHASLLTIPPDGQLIFKIMTVENLLRSIVGDYIHFNRVDSYVDFTGADTHDGQQLPKDQQENLHVLFEKAPDFSIAKYYDQSRARTYACCFSLENSDFIWKSYANGCDRGKVCIVFEFGKLRYTFNNTLHPGNAALEYAGNQCHQIFSVNYGVVEYVEWEEHRENIEYCPNPIKYTYLKNKKQFSEEKELRISLSAVGMGQFVLGDGSAMQFPSSLQLAFDFKAAIADGTIRQILYGSDTDSDFIQSELNKLHIVASSE